MVILEYCPYGTLDDLITTKQRLLPDEFYRISNAIGQALFYCHSRSVAHRDIKPQNIFVNTFGLPILGDFGLAQIYSQHAKDSEMCGSLFYAAPEIFNSNSYDPFKADVWSLGITFYYMASGNLPWKSKTIEEHHQGSIIMFPKKLDPKLETLIRNMLQLDPLQRPSMEKVMSDPFFIVSIPKSFPSKASFHSHKLSKQSKLSLSASNMILQSPLKHSSSPLSLRQRSLRTVIEFTSGKTPSDFG